MCVCTKYTVADIYDDIYLADLLYLKKDSIWRNQLGSVMKICEVDHINGNFTGTYNSAVGNAINEYKLCGRFDRDGSSLGWVVSFKNEQNNANTTTTWSGQILKNPDTNDEPVIRTIWLLTCTKYPLWKSTNIGVDCFEQYCDETRDKEGK